METFRNFILVAVYIVIDNLYKCNTRKQMLNMLKNVDFNTCIVLSFGCQIPCNP